MGSLQGRRSPEVPVLRGSTTRLTQEFGRLVSVTRVHSSIPTCDLEVLDPCGTESANHAAKDERDRNEKGSLWFRLLDRGRRRIDDRNHGCVIHFLHPCGFVLTLQREVQFLADLDLPAKATFLENQLR